MNKLDYAYQHAEPKGVILVIGTWNYPLQCTMVPLIGNFGDFVSLSNNHCGESGRVLG